MRIKLLVIDDSAFMRSAIRLMLLDDHEIEIVGEARDGESAIEMVETLNPDVITMDVTMPGMDGVAATRIIMKRFLRPIIMLSSMTDEGSETTVSALEAGAVDFIPKKSSFAQLDIAQIGIELHKKIRYWGERHLLASVGKRPSYHIAPVRGLRGWGGGFQPELVVIGVSTGGPVIMARLLRSMGPLACPVVIAQHMPSSFTEGFAQHLKMDTGLNVLQASDSMLLLPGMVAICPGGVDTTVGPLTSGRLITRIRHNDASPIHPSVDLLFTSAARLNRRVAAVVMTGMGSDGTLGAQKLADQGFPVLAQEPGECTVDGMPNSVIESGAVAEILNVEGIGARLRQWAGVPADRANTHFSTRSMELT